MTKQSSLLQRGILATTLKALVVLFLLGGCHATVSNIDLSTTALNPQPTGRTITGNAASDYLGYSLRTAGDINGDGYEDIIIGASRKNSNQGAAYVIYGGPTVSLSNLDLSSIALDPLTTGFVIRGNAANDYFGQSVSTAGDINNDGYDDIIVGAYGKNNFRGAVYVIYGGPKSAMSNIDLSSTSLDPATTGFVIIGSSVSSYFGQSVSSAGDIDNDGYDDIIVGASLINSAKGAAYVIYGGPKSLMVNIDLSSTALNPLITGFRITGNAAGDYFGASVSLAGDINNDGYDDIIIGAYGKSSNKGAAYIIYGTTRSSSSNIDLSSIALNPATTGFMISGNTANDRFGYSVSTTGDIDNDGYDDIIVGAYAKNSGQGAVYVIYGGPNSLMVNIDLSSTALNPVTTGFRLTGNAAGDYFGASVSLAGDINNDGYDDIIIGASRVNSSKGAAYVIYGGSKSSRSNIDLSSTPLNPATTGLTIAGNAAGDYFGWSVSTAGDVNNDGYDDFLIGAYGKNSFTGAAYLVYGGPKP
jgi:hypothetical protein